jgi:hypothetical protein
LLGEEFSLTPAKTINRDLEIERFFSLRAAAGTPRAVLPLYNGWEDDRGPSEWTPQDREKILALFRQRLTGKERVRYLTRDPATDK